MRALATTALMSFRMYFRNRASVFWGIVFPLLLMGLIGMVFGRQTPITLTVSLVGRGPLHEQLAWALDRIPIVRLKVEAEGAAMTALRGGDRSLVVVVPDGPPPVTLQVYYDVRSQQIAEAGIAMIRQVVAEANRRAAGAPEVIRLATTGVFARRIGFFDFLLPGMLALTIAQSSLIGVTNVITGYREQGVLKRVLATSVTPLAFLGGLVARFTLVHVMQAAIIFLVGVFVFGAKTSGQIGQLALLSAFGSVVFLGIGFAISTISRSVETAIVMGNAINFPMMFLAGTFWPKEVMPAAMQPLIAGLPLTPLVDAMRGVGAFGEPLAAFSWQLLSLAAWGLGAFAVAAWRFRWE